MLLTLSNIVILASIGTMPVEDAFAILADQRGISSARWEEAREAIDQACPVGDEACIRRLITIWEDPKHEGRFGTVVLHIAFEKADDKTLPIILNAVRLRLDRLEKSGTPRGEADLLGEAGIKLSARLKDPEPLLDLAFETGAQWWGYSCSPRLKDKYVLEHIRRLENDSEGGPEPGGGAAQYLSDEAIPTLRALMREMYRVNPRREGVWNAIPTLVQLSDTEIIPDLEAILASPRTDWPYWPNYEGYVRMYLAKLKHEHDREEVIRIVETERDWSKVLHWAVWRALWLKVDRQTIRDALGKNRRTADVGPRKGRDIAENLLYALFGEGPDYTIDPERGKVPRLALSSGLDYDFDTLIFDRVEFRQYVRDYEAMAVDSRKRTEEEQTEAHRVQKEAEHWTEKQKAEYREGRLRELAEKEAKGWLNMDERFRKYMFRAILEAAPAAKQSPDPAGSAGRGED